MKKLLALTLCVLLILSLAAIPAFASPPLRDPGNPDVISADGADGTSKLNFKDSGGAWASIVQPWGGGVYMMMLPEPESIQSLIITFEVSNYDGGAEGYRAMPGIALNGWITQIWSLDSDGADANSWEEVFGEKYNYYINGDGVYQMIAPLRQAMDFTESEEPALRKDYLEELVVLELGIYGVEEGSSFQVRIINVDETPDIFSFANIQRPADAPLVSSADDLPPLPDAEPSPPPRDDEPGGDDEQPPEDTPPPENSPEATPDETSPEPTPEQASPSPASSDDEGSGSWLWIWLALGGGAVAVVIAVVVAKKKK